MQILGINSEEGIEKGLGLIDGNIFKIKNAFTPHMGWNSVTIKKGDLILNNINNDNYFYFLHSYHFKEKSEKNVIGVSKYENVFSSIIKNENIYGVQFHPEKSQEAGKNLMSNLLDSL